MASRYVNPCYRNSAVKDIPDVHDDAKQYFHWTKYDSVYWSVVLQDLIRFQKFETNLFASILYITTASLTSDSILNPDD